MKKTEKKATFPGRCSICFREFLNMLDARSINSVLDVGCSSGRTFHLLDRFRSAFMVGMDIDKKELKKAHDKCNAVLATGLRLPFTENSFDLIVEFHTFHHIPGYTQAISEAARCLKKGGHFLMVEAVNDNPVFRFFRDKHPIARHMPIESNFMFNELMNSLENSGLKVKNTKRFGIFFEFTLGGIPGVPTLIKSLTSAMDGFLEKFLGTKYCASCVILCEKT